VSWRHRIIERWAYLDAALALILLFGALAYFYNLLVGARGLDLEYIVRNFPLYIHAVFTNVYVTTVAFAAGNVIGFGVGWLRTARTVPLGRVLQAAQVASRTLRTNSDVRPLPLAIWVTGAFLWYGLKYAVRRIGDAFVETIRGTPLYVQILFTSSLFIVFIPKYATEGLLIGILALTVNTGGYQAEIFRAGLQTVHSGQVEAARAIGFSRLAAMRHVVLPQAVRLIIPPLTNEYIGLFKASTLLFALGETSEISYIALHEAYAGDVFEIFAMVTVIFLAITITLSFAARALERRLRIPGLGFESVRRPRGVAVPRIPA
jgi:ABC-type amino acid transport system permease subunit